MFKNSLLKRKKNYLNIKTISINGLKTDFNLL